MSCPSDDELVAFLEGALSSEEAARFDHHLDDCPLCAHAITHLAHLVSDDALKEERYRIESPLGEGGMGVVWTAWDSELERRVALKMIRPEIARDPVARERLIVEARSMARLTHPNVVTVYEVGELDGEMFIATELVDGETLARWQVGRPWREVVEAYLQAARGLHAAHAAGLVHRDVKPSNLLMGRDGRVRVADFGVALPGDSPDADPGARSDERLTQNGGIVGTPAYLAPEQRAGGLADARADQFALCMALAEALTGSRPEAGIARGDLIEAGAPPEVAAVLERGLMRAAERRYSSTDHLADLLAAALAPADRDGRRRRFGMSPWLLYSASALAVGGLLWFLSTSRSQPSAGDAPPQPGEPRTAEDAVKTANRLLQSREGKSCLRVLDEAPPTSDAKTREQLATLRWSCEMVSGDCETGMAHARSAGLSAELVEGQADAYCSVDQGELSVRVRRFRLQVLIYAQYRNAGCETFERSGLALARTPGLADIPGAPGIVQAGLAHLVTCHARERHCDRARRLISRAADVGVVLDEALLEQCR